MGTQFCGSTMWKHAPSRQRLAKVADVLDDADLEVLATNDIFWDTIASIEPLGEQEVYDATVLGHPQLRRRTASPRTTASSRTPTW